MGGHSIQKVAMKRRPVEGKVKMEMHLKIQLFISDDFGTVLISMLVTGSRNVVV